MARSINAIYNEIITEKDTHSSLDSLAPESESATQLIEDLNSNSKVAIWRLWAYIVAVVIHGHEMVWDIFKAEIENIAASAPAGTPRWYQKKMFEFQFGDSLEYIDNQYKYPVIDESKKIIKRCAIEERADGIVLVKCVKEDSGTPIKLSVPELEAAQSYAAKIKFAGTRLGVISIDADEVLPLFNIYYDPIIPLEIVKLSLEEKIGEYLSNLTFNAAFNITKFTDKLQLAEGVVDPVFISASNVNGSGTNSFTVEVIPASGYFILGDTLDNLFTYIQKV